DREAADELLGLGERSVDQAALAVRVADARAVRARLHAFGAEQNAALGQLLGERAHRDDELGRRRHAGLEILVRLDQHHESHVVTSNLKWRALTASSGS